MNKFRFCIAVDFDGTIIENGFPSSNRLLPGAKETINKYYEMGCWISIWTCRENYFKEEAKQFLIKNGINFHDINSGSPEFSHGRKIYANVYIDDKSMIDFSWEKAGKIIDHFYKKYENRELESCGWEKKEKIRKDLIDFYKNKVTEEEFVYIKFSIDCMLGIENEKGR